ncbi:MAG: hypothetical protein JNL06_04160 [Alphaproteobacteria bacterium]|nr:hypothetical protein [Alphaproteobacteria bacterium]
MKHASAAALDALEPLLSEVRRAVGLIERKRGIFYRRSRAFLHFHEDAAGMFADVKLSDDGDYTRLRVSTAAERKAFLVALKKVLVT